MTAAILAPLGMMAAFAVFVTVMIFCAYRGKGNRKADPRRPPRIPDPGWDGPWHARGGPVRVRPEDREMLTAGNPAPPVSAAAHGDLTEVIGEVANETQVINLPADGSVDVTEDNRDAVERFLAGTWFEWADDGPVQGIFFSLNGPQALAHYGDRLVREDGALRIECTQARTEIVPVCPWETGDLTKEIAALAEEGAA